MKLHFVLNRAQHSETKKQEARNRAVPRFLSLGWLCHYLAITPKEELAMSRNARNPSKDSAVKRKDLMMGV
jgi:hypothetical protein